MSRNALRWMLFAAGCVIVWPVVAHEQQGQAAGFVTGLLHPVSGLDHVLAMVAVGLWGAQLGAPAIWLLPVTFPLVMAFGGFLGLVGVPLLGVELGVAASAILLGAMVALQARPPLTFAALLVAFFAVFHGHAHGTELPAGENGLLYSVGFVAATGLLQRLDNYSWASRKDFRDAVVAARMAFDGWNKATAYNRGQILYRAAELLQNRATELISDISRSTGASTAKAWREVILSIDRLVHFAGWTDKYAQVFGSVNPVATAHFNFTTPDPTGVVVVLAPDEPALVSLVSLTAPVMLSGNTPVVVASDKYPLPAVTFSEILATSDLPGGVINILTGKRAELVPHVATHMDVNAVVDGTGQTDLGVKLRACVATTLKRYAQHSLRPADWFTARAEDPY